jgi:hypothetical protein
VQSNTGGGGSAQSNTGGLIKIGGLIFNTQCPCPRNSPVFTLYCVPIPGVPVPNGCTVGCSQANGDCADAMNCIRCTCPDPPGPCAF